MPVYATPSGNPDDCPQNQLPGNKQAPAAVTPLSPSCFNQQIIVANTPKDGGTGRPVLARTHTYNIKGAQKACIDHIMRDTNGNPVDLRDCLGLPITPDPDLVTPPDPNCPVAPVVGSSSLSSGSNLPGSSASLSSESSSSSESPCSGYRMIFRIGEYLTCGGVEHDVEVINAAEGRVRVCLECENTNCPGVYFGEFAMVEVTPDPNDPSNPDGCRLCPIFSNHVYVIVGRNLFQSNMCNRAAIGPPSISEIRLHLRDTSPEESYLLDNVAFSDEEIALAITLPVQYWNEIPPPIGTYSTQNFPYRYHWLMGIAGYLFLTAAEQMRRNNLKYSASGVAVDDQDKEPNYEAAAQRRLDEFKMFVRRKKASLNLEMGYGGIGSTYGAQAGQSNGFRGSQPYLTWYNY